LLDPGARHLVEDLQEGAGVTAGLEGGPSQGRHAGGVLRSGYDPQEPASDAEAHALGLGDGGELVLHVAGDLDGPLQAAAKGLILGLVAGELSPEVVDPSLGRRAIDGLDDLLGLSVERLAGLITIPGHRGHVAVSAAKDGEGTGDTLGNRGHGNSLRRVRSRDHAQDCTRPHANCPRTTS